MPGALSWLCGLYSNGNAARSHGPQSLKRRKPDPVRARLPRFCSLILRSPCVSPRVNPAFLAVQSSIFHIPCKTLNQFTPSCYPALCSPLRSLELLPFLPVYVSWVYPA